MSQQSSAFAIHLLISAATFVLSLIPFKWYKK